MTNQDRINALADAIEAGKTVYVNAMGAQFKLKKTYAAWKHWGRDIFFLDAAGGAHIRTGKTSGRITAASVE